MPPGSEMNYVYFTALGPVLRYNNVQLMDTNTQMGSD